MTQKETQRGVGLRFFLYRITLLALICVEAATTRDAVRIQAAGALLVGLSVAEHLQKKGSHDDEH